MGTPQALESNLNPVDLRCGPAAANDPDLQASEFLAGVDAVELEVEVIEL
ncbi:hypothetical protein [Methylibium petroleiphilum]|nr:hypothetical protein [Methylibium petroleiphilum]